MTSTPARRTDLPTIESDSEPFWAALHTDGTFLLTRCDACAHVFHYPRPLCPRCWSDRLTAVPASGRGTLYTYSVVHLNDLPPFAGQVPYAAAVVALEEGPHVMTRIVDCPLDELAVDLPVVLVPTPLTDEVTIALFAPAGR